MITQALAFAAVLVWAAVVFVLLRFLSAFHSEIQRFGFGARTAERLDALEDQVARGQNVSAELDARLQRVCGEAQAALEDESRRIEQSVREYVREMLAERVDPVRERVVRVEAVLEEIRLHTGASEKIESLQGTVDEMGRALLAMSDRLAGLPDAIRDASRPDSGGSEVAGLAERLSRLEQAAEKMGKRRQDSLRDVDKALKELQQQVDELNAAAAGRLEQPPMPEEASATLAALQQSVVELAEEVGRLRGNIPEQEPADDIGRISARSEAPPEEGEGSASPGGAAGRKGPRVISAAGRERYEEVLAQWAEGRSAEQIAIMTGLDVAEIELMVAGETPQSSPS